MLLTILSYVLVSVTPLGAYLGYKKLATYKTTKVLSTPKVTPSAGISVVDYTIPDETEEEYLKRLRFIHSSAWSECVKDKSKILELQDRYVNMLILKYRNNEVTVTANTHTLDFSDGTTIWIANKYYAYGNIYGCKNKSMIFSSSEGRLSTYTFMSLVDLEMEITNFSMWKKHHDDYSRKRISTIKKKLGV